MTWLNPQYWQEGPHNRKNKILQLFNYFEVPLAATKSCVHSRSHASNVTKILLQNPYGKMFQYRKK